MTTTATAIPLGCGLIPNCHFLCLLLQRAPNFFKIKSQAKASMPIHVAVILILSKLSTLKTQNKARHWRIGWFLRARELEPHDTLANPKPKAENRNEEIEIVALWHV